MQYRKVFLTEGDADNWPTLNDPLSPYLLRSFCSCS